jgi:cyclase
MNRPRFIPVMLIEQRRAVKTQRFKDPTYIGDPVNTTRIFSEKGVDELIVLDITATPKREPLDVAFISRIAEEAFMPFSYGGGLRTLNDAQRLFEVGIEKVILGWTGEETLKLMNEIAHVFGAQAISVCIDVSSDTKVAKKCKKLGKHIEHRSDAAAVLQRIQNSGSGEIILQNVDFDGMMTGMDIELIKQICESARVPVVALGGAGSINHMAEAVANGASAVASGSMFVFHDMERAVLINYPTDVEIEHCLRKII